MLLIGASLGCASCDRPAIDPSLSLVGAKALPTAHQLSNELIEVYRESFEPGPRLVYDLQPDDILIITLTDWDSDEAIIGKQSFQLSSSAAREARKSLWRLRPEQLEGMESDIRLAGCPEPGLEEFPDFTIGFLANGRRRPRTWEEIGPVGIVRIFPGCKIPRASEARTLLQKVLSEFPQSSLTAEYERRDRLLKAKLKSLKPRYRMD